MTEIAIRVENLSKQYKIGVAKQRHNTLRDQLADALRGLFRRNGQRLSARGHESTIWALKDVSFEVRQGEVLGIIGRNGAGKSTLLKILSRITEPTEGRAEIHGRVGSLLEVGTGFHPELTGRENIYLNGTILGMRKAEIHRQFDEIVAFAEIEKFIDTPVKRYSSGMYLRLAFAVGAHLEPEILIIDEVLAVGDAAFQRKCLGRIGHVAQEGRTVLFVTHNMAAVAELCRKAVLLEKGRLVASGQTEEVITRYLSGLADGTGTGKIGGPKVNRGVMLRQVSIFDQHMKPSSRVDFRFPFSIAIDFALSQPLQQLSLWIRLMNQYGVNVVFSWAIFQAAYNPGTYVAQGQFPQALLTPGRYYIDVGAEHYKVEEYHHAFNCLSFDIVNTSPEYDGSTPNEWGAVLLQIPWQLQE